ncbi:MAG: glycerol-3-phosphate acyltransferase [Promethearchaeota archaeon]
MAVKKLLLFKINNVCYSMDPITLLIDIFSLLLGYFAGTLNPGYLFGKMKGIDIREVGTKNAGTSNVYRSLGIGYAIPTALYDTLKGLLVMLIANLMGADFIFIQISGLLTIIGHIFPFYLKFRGGQGVAAATGILLFHLVNYIISGLEIFYIIAVLLVLVAIFTYITKQGSILPMIVLPVLCYGVFVFYPTNPYNFYFLLILAHITFMGAYNVFSRKSIRIDDESFKVHWWRVAIRPFAILFVVFYVYYEKNIVLIIIGIVGLCFIVLDLFRFIHKQTNKLLTEKVKALFRKSEEKAFSSMTLFLVAAFITILVFDPKEIAITALTFLVFGDIFSKIFGLAFGRHKLLHEAKSIEGTLAYVGCVIICIFILSTTLNISIWILIIGGIAAPLVELFSFNLNDNFTVSLISGAVMYVGVVFGL